MYKRAFIYIVNTLSQTTDNSLENISVFFPFLLNLFQVQIGLFWTVSFLRLIHMEIIRSDLFLYPVILCILTLSWIKVEVVNSMCSHFISFVWRHCVDKPIFLRNQQKQPAINLNCIKHAIKQTSCLWLERDLFFILENRTYLQIIICASVLSLLCDVTLETQVIFPHKTDLLLSHSSVSLQM